MKTGIPALNIIASLLYLSLAGVSLFVLKLTSKPQLSPRIDKKQPQKQQSGKVYHRMALSWLKKYCLFGALMPCDKKYLSKQLLILSVYGVSCLKINKITLWPVALITFLLPLIFFLFEVLLKYQSSRQSSQQQNKAGNEVQLEVQPDPLEANKGVTTHQLPKHTRKLKQFKHLYEIVALSLIVFIAVVLDLQAVTVLDSSISNSGQLNLISVICNVLVDQLLVRPFSGLLFLTVIKILEKKEAISLSQNILVVFFCEQVQREQQVLQEQRKTRALFESTEAHLKNKQQDLRDTNVPIKPDRASMVYIDFQNTHQQQHKQTLSPHQVLNQSQKEVIKGEEIYLTTPQKELFQIDTYSNNHETIVNTYLCDKQNLGSNSNNSRMLYQPTHKQDINCFEELILTKDHHPLQNIQNIQPCFKTQVQMAEEHRKKAQNKRKNRRVLKITGNSPYLQYLPNMLKNVRKGAQTTAVTTTTAPKLAQLNFR